MANVHDLPHPVSIFSRNDICVMTITTFIDPALYFCLIWLTYLDIATVGQ